MEYELVNRPHPHPLLFENKEINGDVAAAVCCRCRLALYPPAFRCLDSDCNFRIHKSCIHLPSHIHNTPFHPQHPLLLKRTDFGICSACGRFSSGDLVYECKECKKFELDIGCAIGDKEIPKASGFWMREKYVHFTHPHPLSLSSLLEQQQQIKRSIIVKKLSVCVMCERPVQSGSSSYFCSKSQCDYIHYHKQCAELACVFQNPDFHPHPLFLFNRSYDMLCNSCRNKCSTRWVYGCTICKFYLHITCMKSFNHIHTFTNIFPNKTSFTCTVCGQNSSEEFPWCCDKCYTLVHKKCAELPSIVMTSEHDHVLTLNYFIPPDIDQILCQICGGEIVANYGVYACSTCNNFTAHLKCAIEISQTHDHDHDHDSAADHDHHEYLMSEENTNNNINNICDLVLPEEYTNLPKTIKPLSRLHPHPLTLISTIPDFIFQCEVCLQHFNGVAYHCKTCLSTLDVRCATLTNPLKHPNHEHPLYLCTIENIGGYIICAACGKEAKEKLAFRCSICHFYLDIRCGTLPVEVRYRFDEHPLKLTFGEGGERTSDYYCDICEEEREMGIWFYCCRECKYEAHTRCALGEFPYVKSGKHKSHNHPLNPKTLKLESTSSGYSKLAFQCGVCKFTLDENEERSLDFNFQNVFSRAIQLYHHYPIPEQKIGVSVKLGPFGNKRTNTLYWKEWVFSTISGFGIFINEEGMIESIKIQYVKNGELVWSKQHGKDNMMNVQNTKTTETVICFDYPNEYLVSFHGSYGNYGRSRGMLITGITSLTLKTNTKTHGPFGNEVGKKFTSLKNGVKIVGIFGYYSTYGLASIGFFGVSTNKDQ